MADLAGDWRTALANRMGAGGGGPGSNAAISPQQAAQLQAGIMDRNAKAAVGAENTGIAGIAEKGKEQYQQGMIGVGQADLANQRAQNTLGLQRQSDALRLAQQKQANQETVFGDPNAPLGTVAAGEYGLQAQQYGTQNYLSGGKMALSQAAASNAQQANLFKGIGTLPAAAVSTYGLGKVSGTNKYLSDLKS